MCYNWHCYFLKLFLSRDLVYKVKDHEPFDVSSFFNVDAMRYGTNIVCRQPFSLDYSWLYTYVTFCTLFTYNKQNTGRSENSHSKRFCGIFSDTWILGLSVIINRPPVLTPLTLSQNEGKKWNTHVMISITHLKTYCDLIPHFTVSKT